MIIAGTLLKPDNSPWLNQSVRIISALTSYNVLKTVEAEFKTDSTGGYSVEVPIGLYRVAVLTAARGYVDIGMITVEPGAPSVSLNTLIMIQQTVSPRDPLLDALQQMIADFEASGGGTGTVRFTWPQDIPAAVWTIPHNMSAFPSVTVVDSTGARVEADVRYVDANIVQVTHGQAYSGKAFLN